MPTFLIGLGNFLSGMETLFRRGGLCRGMDLGNFLSGMETSFRGMASTLLNDLGNFLSGMETDFGVVTNPDGSVPWKLP